MINYLNILAANQGATQGAAGVIGSFVFMLIVMVGLIVLMIVPQKKREKQARAMLDSLKVGTRIRTIGGIYGTVVNVKEDLVTIVSGPDDVKLVFVKGAVAAIESEEEKSEEKEQDTETAEQRSAEKKSVLGGGKR